MYSFASFILTISLHDALPIFHLLGSNDPLDIVALLDDLRKRASHLCNERIEEIDQEWIAETEDRKSTRLNSSHVAISYAVFCLTKKRLSWLCLARDLWLGLLF